MKKLNAALIKLQQRLATTTDEERKSQFLHEIQRVQEQIFQLQADEEIRQDFQRTSRLGSESPNQWIRRSAEVPGYLFSGEHEFLLQHALDAPLGHFIEIGIWFGKSTSLLAGAAEERNKGEKVFCFDPFTNEGNDEDRRIHKILHGLDNAFPIFVQNAKRLGYYKQLVPVATFSTLALPWINLKAAFAFIDGAHDEESVKVDFNLVQDKLNPGAKILFHDALGGYFPGVLRAIETILRNNSSLIRIGDAGTIVALQKC